MAAAAAGKALAVAQRNLGEAAAECMSGEDAEAEAIKSVAVAEEHL